MWHKDKSLRYAKDLRIGIIGAGPSGLAAAEALKERGYQNITVIERHNRVGGMSMSLRYPGEKGDVVYEMGSFAPVGSRKLFRLFHRYGLHVGKTNTRGNVDTPIRRRDLLVFLIIHNLKQHKAIIDFDKYRLGYPLRQWPALFSDSFKLARCFWRYRALEKPGHELSDDLTAELCLPYETWVDQQRLSLVGDVMKMFASTAAFSNPDIRPDISAFEVIKFFYQLLHFPLRYISGHLGFVREGYQELWNRVAKQHHVLYKQNIQAVHRHEQTVDVVLDDQTLTFDKLFVTCSPAQALKFLDATIEERSVFEKVHYAPGWKVSFLAQGLPHNGLYSLMDPYLTDADNYRECLQSFYPEGWVKGDIWLYTGVTNVAHHEFPPTFYSNSEKMLQQEFGAKVLQWVDTFHWAEYTPYFLAEDVKTGIRKRFHQLQGKQNTYYLGGAISGSSHATVTEYAYSVVNRFF